METIFHEKQEGSLCAQHCLNALLQAQYFSPVDLAQIGGRLDEQERERMAEGGVATQEYQQFIEQPSSNFDDSGFFSVQVLSEALSVWSLDMILYNSQNPIAQQARIDPTSMSAFICNFQQHWFCVRKLGLQWFNLNSLLTGPELISSTYLSLFLTQLQQEGYSIFIICGSLPTCEADQLLRLTPAVQTVKPTLLQQPPSQQASRTSLGEEDELAQALRESREAVEGGDAALQRALQASMEGYEIDSSSTCNVPNSPTPSSHKSPTLTPAQLREKRLAFLESKNSVQGNSPEKGDTGHEGSSSFQKEDAEAVSEVTEEELLQRAIAMSMEKADDS